MESAVIIEILAMAAKYGIPAVSQAVKAFGKDKVALEDVQELEGLVKTPESYFTGEDE